MRLLLVKLLLISTISAAVADQIENGVLILDQKNFKDTLKANTDVLVQFCNMKIKRCQEQQKELEQAAQLIKEQNLPFTIASFDINYNEKFAKQYIGNNKAMKSILFRDVDEKINYGGQNQAAKMVHWLIKIEEDLCKQVTCGELKQEKYKNDFTLAYFGNVTQPLYKRTYDRYALHEHRIHYVHLGIDESNKCGSQYGVEKDQDGIVLFRMFDDTNYIFEEKKHDAHQRTQQLEQLKNFVNPLLLPHFFEFVEDEHKSLIFDTPQNALFLIGADLKADYMKTYEEAALQNKGLIPFTYHEAPQSSFVFQQSHRWMVPEKEFPVLIGYVPKGNQKSIFHLKPWDFTVENLNEFAKKISNGQVEATKLKSEPTPETQDGHVQKIVGDSYNSVALHEDHNVFMYLFDSQNKTTSKQNGAHDKVFESIINQLSELEVKGMVFGKIDMALNEVRRSEIKKIKDYPAFILYTKGKEQQGHTYHPMGSKVPGLEKRDEDINEEHLMDFIQKHLNKADRKPPPRSANKGRKEPKKNSKQAHMQENLERAKKYDKQVHAHDEL